MSVAVPSFRDYLIARCAVARQSLQGAIDSIDEIIGHCIDPSEDDDMTERAGELTEALEFAGEATRALEDAEKMVALVKPTEIEPWDTEEEEPEPLPRATVRRPRSRR